jgi:exosome complex component RRP45
MTLLLRQNDLETLLSRFLEKAIRRSNALDTESLCIVAGQKCWTVRADVHVLNHDGNLVDAACIAVVTALQHFRRPDVSVEGEEVKVFSISERVPVPLSLLHHPYCISVGFFHQGTVAIVDPTLLEQQISEGEMIVTANRHGEVCQIAKLGGVPTDALPLLESIHLAASKATEISKRVTSALDEDSNERNLGGLVSELTAENER